MPFLYRISSRFDRLSYRTSTFEYLLDFARPISLSSLVAIFLYPLAVHWLATQCVHWISYIGSHTLDLVESRIASDLIGCGFRQCGQCRHHNAARCGLRTRATPPHYFTIPFTKDYYLWCRFIFHFAPCLLLFKFEQSLWAPLLDRLVGLF